MLISKDKFYEWAYSDLLVNNQRGHFAEFIVAVALDITSSKRLEWDPYDLLYRNVKIEIKSAAYIQSWQQKKPSTIGFDIKQTRNLNFQTDKQEEQNKRQSDLYIFCHLKHKDRNTIDPTNVSQWDFYIVPTKILDEKFNKQKRISLSVLKKNGFNPVEFKDIKNNVDMFLSLI